MKGSQKGIGLIEIMISLFLATLIMTALMQHYISTKQNYVHLQSELEEATGLQLAIDLMRNSIQQAGFTPCLSLNELLTLDTRDGHEPLAGIYLRPNPQPMLQINRMSTYFDTVISLNGATEIIVSRSHGYTPEHPIVIADCYHAEVHSIRGIRQTDTSQIITLNSPLAFQYEFPVYMGEWLEEQFFVRKEGGLFYHAHHTDALTADVRSMVPTTLQNTPSGLIVHVVLGFDRAHNIEVDARVRAS